MGREQKMREWGGGGGEEGRKRLQTNLSETALHRRRSTYCALYRISEKSNFSSVSTCERRLCCHCYKMELEALSDSYFTSLTKRVYRPHSVMRNTTSCNSKPSPAALQTSVGELITFQIIFQILYCHRYKHERLKKLSQVNKPDSTYLLNMPRAV